MYPDPLAANLPGRERSAGGMSRGIAPTQWQVQDVDPRDHFEDATLTIEQWFANVRASKSPRAIEQAWVDLMAAIRAVTSEMDPSDWKLRCEPRVAYDAVRDAHYFIFKMDEDGVTYLVSANGLDLTNMVLND